MNVLSTADNLLYYIFAVFGFCTVGYFQCKAMHVYSAVSLVVFNGSYSQVSLCRTAIIIEEAVFQDV